MKRAVLVCALPLAACTQSDNLGNSLREVDAAAPSVAPTVDAATPAPDANPPHTFTWWGTQLGALPDQACDPWALDDTAASDPVLGQAALTLHTANGERLVYAQRGADLTANVPTSMLVEAGVQLIDGVATVRFGYHGWTDDLTISDGVVTTGRGATVALPTTDAMHYYRLEIDPWTGWVVVKADDVVIAEESASNLGGGVTESIEFGQLEAGTSAWGEIAHDVHATTNCPLP